MSERHPADATHRAARPEFRLGEGKISGVLSLFLGGLHVVDVVVTRAFGFVPLYILGFANGAIVAYLAWASFQSILIHSNLRARFGPLRYVIATPQFHHWHHSATLYDKNFAVHLPLIDKLFGTYHLPADEWPEAYGLQGLPVPYGYVEQLVYPVSAGRHGRAEVNGPG